MFSLHLMYSLEKTMNKVIPANDTLRSLFCIEYCLQDVCYTSLNSTVNAQYSCIFQPIKYFSIIDYVPLLLSTVNLQSINPRPINFNSLPPDALPHYIHLGISIHHSPSTGPLQLQCDPSTGMSDHLCYMHSSILRTIKHFQPLTDIMLLLPILPSTSGQQLDHKAQRPYRRYQSTASSGFLDPGPKVVRT
jgi:hypothetical protein